MGATVCGGDTLGLELGVALGDAVVGRDEGSDVGTSVLSQHSKNKPFSAGQHNPVDQPFATHREWLLHAATTVGWLVGSEVGRGDGYALGLVVGRVDGRELGDSVGLVVG